MKQKIFLIFPNDKESLYNKFEINLNDNIKDFKEKQFKKYSEYEIFFDGKILNDFKNFNDYKIKEDSKLYIITPKEINYEG